MEYAQAVENLLIDNAPALVGFLLPPLIEILNKQVYNRGERFFVAMLTCALTAVLLHWREIELGNPAMVSANFLLIATESQLLYKTYFGDSWLRGYIQTRIGTEWGGAMGKTPVIDEPVIQ